jgi:hypothetical protein
MKRMSIYRILVVLVIATTLFAACTKEKTEVTLAQKLSTSQLLNVKSDSATVVGFVVAAGDGFFEKGVCYNTATAPTIANTKVVFTAQSNMATYTVKLGGLAYATKYYARAYATGANGTLYGEEVTFTTLPVVPTVSTAAITAVTGKTATGGGNVSITGGAAVTARGVCFGTAHAPTTTASKTSDGTGAGAFTSALTGLKGNITYYVRSYATNAAGTGYGLEVAFTTPVDLPVVTTAAVTGTTKVAAVSGGEVTYDGGGTITARGLVWSANASPSITDNNIAGGTGTGIFVSNLTGLVKYTTYHVRAYATNSAGTAYGSDVQFTTLSDILTWNIPGDYVEASYPGSTLANWSPDKSPQVISTITAGDKLEGYVYMANASNSWKFATQANWNGPNYGDGGAGKLDANGGNMSSAKGYYKLNADATAMIFTAVATVWGVIGDATPGGWGAQTNMTYSPTAQTFSLGVHMTSGAAFKFRGTSDWSVNYGSDAANGTALNAGGANIAVTNTADYAITLDLSHPNVYTYSANTWGLVGAFTNWSGNPDVDMTWDSVNHVFTATANIIAAGEWKFRANHDWGVNFGGTLDALTQGGGNLSFATPGNYTVTLDPWARKATVTKN